MEIELYIGGADGKVYQPITVEGVEWTTERKGTPGKLTFQILKDDVVNFTEGAAVRLCVNKSKVFFGFVFKQQRKKDQIITVTAYDQLRYLKNNDTYVYAGKTASQVIQMIASDFGLQTGSIDDTKFVIPSRVEDNTSLFDIIGNALDITLQSTGEMYVLYDDFGKITLKNIGNMHVGKPGAYLMIDNETAEDYDYQTSIDDNTYNQVKLTFDNEETGKREVYMAKDSSHINQWGVLQHYDTLSKGENGAAKADALLKLYNAKTRTLKFTNVLGDLRVRAGSLIAVVMDLGDTKIKNFMIVESARHIFSENEHFMDLTMRGGEFVG